jgi:hypothetical protein
MATIDTFPASKLHREIKKRNAADSKFIRLLIDAGYGNTTGNQLDAMVKTGNAPKLVIDARAASRAYHQAADELDRRRRWNGNDRPIKRILG